MRATKHKEYKRADRVGDLIARHLATLLLEKIADPRLKRCTITGVTLSDDLRNAKVYFSMIHEDQSEVDQARKALGRAAGFFRREIGAVLELRHVPELRFYYDNSLERGSHLLALMEEIKTEDHEEDL